MISIFEGAMALFVLDVHFALTFWCCDCFVKGMALIGLQPFVTGLCMGWCVPRILSVCCSGFVKGEVGEIPHHIAFQPSFDQGALLSVVSCGTL